MAGSLMGESFPSSKVSSCGEYGCLNRRLSILLTGEDAQTMSVGAGVKEMLSSEVEALAVIGLSMMDNSTIRGEV